MTYWLSATSLLLLGVLAYAAWDYASKPKTGFVLNQQLFEDFAGKVELEARLDKVKSLHQEELDSLQALSLEFGKGVASRLFEAKSRQYAEQEQSLSAKYTRQIWGQINDYIKQYGDEHNYDMIFGATGDGSLMYSNEAHDITREVTDYINQKYQGE